MVIEYNRRFRRQGSFGIDHEKRIKEAAARRKVATRKRTKLKKRQIQKFRKKYGRK